MERWRGALAGFDMPEEPVVTDRIPKRTAPGCRGACGISPGAVRRTPSRPRGGAIEFDGEPVELIEAKLRSRSGGSTFAALLGRTMRCNSRPPPSVSFRALRTLTGVDLRRVCATQRRSGGREGMLRHEQLFHLK